MLCQFSGIDDEDKMKRNKVRRMKINRDFDENQTKQSIIIEIELIRMKFRIIIVI